MPEIQKIYKIIEILAHKKKLNISTHTDCVVCILFVLSNYNHS